MLKNKYNAKLDIWNTMAYFVAKELSLRPMDILTKWSCEELLVAYGNYANSRTSQYIDTIPKKEWAKKHITWLDRWAVLFITPDQAEELTRDVDEAQAKSKDEVSIENAANILFGN